MRLRQIEVFHAIYSCGSMTSAASMLNVSQPSVSKVLAHAEQQLGYLLFDRVKGRLVPTPEAHHLFHHVSAVYTDVSRLRHIAENLREGNSGHIRIAGTPAFGLEVLPRSVATFRQQFDRTIFEIETLHLDEMTEALLEERVDLGLAFDPDPAFGLEAQTIARSRFVVLAPADFNLQDMSSLSAHDLCSHPFVGLKNHGPLGRALSTYLGPVESNLEVVTSSETYYVAKALAACGVGITITDEITAYSGSTDDIQIIPLEPELCFDIKVLSLADAPQSIAARNFIQHLTASIDDFINP